MRVQFCQGDIVQSLMKNLFSKFNFKTVSYLFYAFESISMHCIRYNVASHGSFTRLCQTAHLKHAHELGQSKSPHMEINHFFTSHKKEFVLLLFYSVGTSHLKNQ
ncbi:hypothetical protein KFK09_026269 [Dendrobium nobile]|uniref:Uncharacterized protein n=1 Tax=Dendrobium nobile TaxID=94219 RepID=A0A8T3ACG1_DENNO|nr:hypothetical protein KFK09_026269 [Dendrobium nobile]